MEERRSPRILFIRPDHLGDVLLTLPAVAALRRALPDARLAYAVPAGSAAVPEHCPQLDATLTLPFPPPGRGGAEPVTWGETARTEAARLANAYDAALVVRPDDPWSGEVVAAAVRAVLLHATASAPRLPGRGKGTVSVASSCGQCSGTAAAPAGTA